MNYQVFVPNLIGLLGVGLVLLAYILLQFNYCKAQDIAFSLINLIGACCILISLFFSWNLASVTIEVIWIAISAYRIIHTLICQRAVLSSKGLSAIDLRVNRGSYFCELQDQEKAQYLKQLGDGWVIDNGKTLMRSWDFDSYEDSIVFVNQVSEQAEKDNHHPVFLIEYKKIVTKMWTHNLDALTQADYVLASKISDCYRHFSRNKSSKKTA